MLQLIEQVITDQSSARSFCRWAPVDAKDGTSQIVLCEHEWACRDEDGLPTSSC